MNAQQFFQYIEHPDKLGIHEEVQLRGVLKEFPYFQSAHMLLAKCLKNMENYTFEKQLRMAAVFSSNRAVMYQLLKTVQRPEVLASAAHQVVSESPQAKPAALVPQPVDETPAENPIQPLLPSVMDTPNEVVEELAPETPMHTKAETAETPPLSVLGDPDSTPNTVAPGPPEVDHLEKRRLEIAAQYEAFLKRKEALSGATLRVPAEIQAVPSETPIPQTPKPTEENPENVAEPAPVKLAEVVADLQDTGELTIPSAVAHPSNTAETHSFAEWLRLATGSKEASKEPEVATISLEEKAETPAPILSASVSPNEIDAILERFIHQNPSISRPKSEFFNPVKAAQKSLEDSGDLVTETLARMHEKQGNYQKAITIYEKLSLKFPEKASIFAALITELKNKIN